MIEVTEERFEELVSEALDDIPDELAQHMENVAVFVRDRGAGFDPDAIAADRQGVRSSIVDRMSRHGGSADVRSAPGEGTEVRLHMPRSTSSHPADEENR